MAILRSLINFAFSSLFKTISTISKYCYSEQRKPNVNINITMKKMKKLFKLKNKWKQTWTANKIGTKYCQNIMALTCVSWNQSIKFSLSLSKHLFLDLNKNLSISIDFQIHHAVFSIFQNHTQAIMDLESTCTCTYMIFFCSSGSVLLACSIRWLARLFHRSTSFFRESLSMTTASFSPVKSLIDDCRGFIFCSSVET